MITNDAGEVAMVYYMPVQKYIQVGKAEYVFVPKHSVSFAWVKPEDVPGVLSVMGGCNCPNSTKKPIFRYATEGQYRVWNELGR